MIYFVVFLLLLVIALIEPYTKKQQKKYLTLVSVLIVVCFQGLRWETGTDWLPYYEGFVNSADRDYIEVYGFEIGYSFLNTFVYLLTKSFTVFLFVECCLIQIFYEISLKALNINNIPFFILTSFLPIVFPIRFTLAVAILFFSYVFILRNKFIPYLLCILLAISIHRSAILFVPAYFIGKIELSLKWAILVYAFSIVVGFAFEVTFGSVLQMLSIIYSGIGKSYQGKLDSYVTGEIPEYAEMTPTKLLLAIINSLIFIILFFYFKRKVFQSDRLYSMLLTLYVFGMCWNRIFLQVIPDFARVTAFYSCGFNIMLIMIISKCERKNQIFLFMFLAIYYCIKYWLNINGYYKDLYLPYYSVFSTSGRPGGTY